MRIGIIGTGNMGSTHARKYAQMPGVELGFRDKNEERNNTLASELGAKTFGCSTELIDWADAVSVCLPTDFHAEYGHRVIAGKKALFLEKPITGNLADGVALVEAAEEAGVPLMVGQVVRYFPEYESAKRQVDSGKVGTPAAARARRGGKAPSGSGLWYMDHARSGGVLLDLAIHDFDWLRWTLGEVKHLYSRSVGIQTGSGPDYALTTLTFDSGAVAHVESTWMDPSGFRTAFEVAGSEGLIEFDSRKSTGVRTITDGLTRNEMPLVPTDDPYYRQLSAFVESVRSGNPVPVTGRDGLSALAIALAAIESARTGNVVAPERF